MKEVGPHKITKYNEREGGFGYRCTLCNRRVHKKEKRSDESWEEVFEDIDCDYVIKSCDKCGKEIRVEDVEKGLEEAGWGRVLHEIPDVDYKNEMIACPEHVQEMAEDLSESLKPRRD